MNIKPAIYHLVLVLTMLPGLIQAQVPAAATGEAQKILIMNATAHLGNGEVVENSAIAMEGGKIAFVKDAATIRIDPEYYDEIIKAPGKHVYPGFISPNSVLGLFEIGAVRATRDYDETGAIIPHVRSLIAYNTESKITPTVRSNGVLLAQITPQGGLISGTSSIVQLDGWNWEDAVLKADDGIHVRWPGRFKNSGWWAEPGTTRKAKKSEEEITKLRTFFKAAQAYSKESDQTPKNLRMEAMRGVFSGEKTVFIYANQAREIVQVANFKNEFDIPKVVLVGGYDAWRVPELLKDHNISVILRRVHSLPMRPDDPIDLPYRLPYLLQEANILFCLENSGDMEAISTRNLGFYAGTAAAYGMDKEAALKTITSNAAIILGIDDRVGTLEAGKDATLFISTGDALDMRTQNIESAFIQGRAIDVNNHQKELYEKYRAKYQSEGKLK